MTTGMSAPPMEAVMCAPSTPASSEVAAAAGGKKRPKGRSCRFSSKIERASTGEERGGAEHVARRPRWKPCAMRCRQPRAPSAAV